MISGKKQRGFLLMIVLLLAIFVPVVAMSGWERTLTAEWEYVPPDGDTVKNFNLYNGSVVVASFDGDDRSGTFLTSMTARSNDYTLTAVLDDDTESPPSEVYTYRDKGPSGRIKSVYPRE